MGDALKLMRGGTANHKLVGQEVNVKGLSISNMCRSDFQSAIQHRASPHQLQRVSHMGLSSLLRLRSLHGLRVGRPDAQQVLAARCKLDPDTAAAPSEDAGLNLFDVRVRGSHIAQQTDHEPLISHVLRGVAKLVSFAKSTTTLKISQICFAKVSRIRCFHCYIFCEGIGDYRMKIGYARVSTEDQKLKRERSQFSFCSHQFLRKIYSNGNTLCEILSRSRFG